MTLNSNYASKGVAGAGLGLGIGGAALGVLNSMGGLANLGGLFGGNRSSVAQNDILTALLTADMVRGRSSVPCGSDCDPVTQREMQMAQELAAKESENALLKANTYNDQKSIELYRYIDGKFIEFEKQSAAQAVQNQANKDSFVMLQQQMAADKAELQAEICCEKKERKAADDIIVNYANATFYPKMVANVTTGDTTTAQATFNPLPACTCTC